ncbi:MAG: DUF4403 family protein [Rhizomicrobium sp.]|jgi:hypothetical protein
MSVVFPLCAALTACGFQAPPPVRTPVAPTPPPPLSTLAATLVIPASELARELNDKTETHIADIHNQPVDCAIAKCLLNLEAVRTGPIAVVAQDDKLTLTVPLAVNAQMPVKASFFKTTANGTAAGTATVTTMLSLGSDWRVHSNTTGAITLSQGQLKVGPLKMSIAELWNRNAQRLSQPLFKSLDKHVASEVKVRPQIERLWVRVTKPLRVGKSPQSWLVLSPERIRVAQPRMHDNVVTVGLGVDVRSHVVVLDHSPEPAQTPPLPLIAPMTAPSNRFSFVVPVLLPYDEASQLAMKRLSDKPLRIGGMTVSFQSLTIEPSGQDVIVATRFCVKQGWDPFGWFDSCGEGYLRGVPQFDAATQTVRIVNVHYDIGTESVILTALRALAGDELGKVLQTKLVFGVGAQMAKLDDDVREALAKKQARGVQIWGDVESFGTPTLAWTNEGFLATFPAQGTISVDLNLKQ